MATGTHHMMSTGPSPHARGAVERGEVEGDGLGTIPAGAGSSLRRPAFGGSRRDHPRGRGEQCHGPRRPGPRPGPSPRARGAGDGAFAAVPVAGTIPAGAGSSVQEVVRRARARDHPRGRGEQCSRSGAPSKGAGPSPRARGAATPHSWSATAPGTIPAGAGSRSCAGRSTSGCGDHPRGRGEQGEHAFEEARAEGPSPRARGAGCPEGVSPTRRGTIPAGAGSR